MKRGSHISARMQFREFLETEMVDMVRRGYWVVVPYHVIRHLLGLKISPAGVVPQRARRPRTIIDFSFSGVNQSTTLLLQWKLCNLAMLCLACSSVLFMPTRNLAQYT